MQTLVKVLDSRNAPEIECRTALHAALAVLQTGQVTAGLNDLFDALRASREVEPATWLERARACLHHPICGLLHQDPFTFRAFSKPRGYAGDAVMMDYIYGLGDGPVKLTAHVRGATAAEGSTFALCSPLVACTG